MEPVGNDSLADYYEPFYKSTGQEKQAGQIVFCPVAQIERRPYIADAVRSDAKEHRSADIEIRRFDETKDYKEKDRLPIAALPNLRDRSELVISINKVRPAVILGEVGDVDPNKLPEGWQKRKALNAFDAQYIVAPIYSLGTSLDPRAFGPVMAARVRASMYKEFMYIPQHEPVLKYDSVCRLDHTFLSPLTCGINFRDLWLSDEVFEFLFQHFFWMLGKEPEDEFMEIRNMLLEGLPEEAS